MLTRCHACLVLVVAVHRRDAEVIRLAKAKGCAVVTHATHTLRSPEDYMAKCRYQLPPTTYHHRPSTQSWGYPDGPWSVCGPCVDGWRGVLLFVLG